MTEKRSENFIEAEFCPGYFVRTDGTILSSVVHGRWKHPRVLRQHENGHGYLCVRIAKDGKAARVPVHRVVALTFLGSPKDRQQVRHLDGNKRNNSVENLAWGTAKENAADRERHGTTASGDRNGARTKPERLARGDRHGMQTTPGARLFGERTHLAKLTAADVIEIRRQRAQGDTYESIAKRFAIDQSQVGHIVKRRNWRHVPDALLKGGS